MNKNDLIPIADGTDDSDGGWVIRFEPSANESSDQYEWENAIAETQELAREAESGTISQVRVGNRLMRFVWFLFARKEDHASSNLTHAKVDHQPPTLGDIEQALEDFYDVHALQNNPLSRALYLSRHRRANEPKALAAGYALQRALNEALDHFTGPAPRTIHDKGLRLQHYLHFRYREELQHNELADALDYDERHLRRLRAKLIRDFAQVLSALNALRR